MKSESSKSIEKEIPLMGKLPCTRITWQLTPVKTDQRIRFLGNYRMQKLDVQSHLAYSSAPESNDNLMLGECVTYDMI